MSTGLLSCASPLSPSDGAPRMPLFPPGSSPSPGAAAPPGFPPEFGWFLPQSLASLETVTRKTWSSFSGLLALEMPSPSCPAIAAQPRGWVHRLRVCTPLFSRALGGGWNK